jgi:hypothetical protein
MRFLSVKIVAQQYTQESAHWIREESVSQRQSEEQTGPLGAG